MYEQSKANAISLQANSINQVAHAVKHAAIAAGLSATGCRVKNGGIFTPSASICLTDRVISSCKKQARRGRGGR